MYTFQDNILFFYIIIPLLLFLFKDRRGVGILFYLISGLMIVSIGLRADVIGSDTTIYKESYDYMTFLDSENYEATWIAICGFVRFQQKDFWCVQFIYSIITIFPICYIISKDSKLPYFSLLLFVILGFYFYSFNIIRQMAAVSMGGMAVYFFVNKRNLYSIIFCVLAILFHKTAVFILIILLFYSFFSNSIAKNTEKILFISLILGLFIFSFFKDFAVFSPVEKYQSYGEYADEKEANILALFLMNCTQTFFNIAFYKKQKKDLDNQSYFCFYTISTMLLNLFAYNIGMNRLAYYFSIISIITIPNIYYNKNKDAYYIIYIIFCFLLYSHSICQNSSEIYPFNI